MSKPVSKQTAFEIAVTVASAETLAAALRHYAATTMGGEKATCLQHAAELEVGARQCQEGGRQFKCECEQDKHFGGGFHAYGKALATVMKKTPYGEFAVCGDCAEGCITLGATCRPIA